MVYLLLSNIDIKIFLIQINKKAKSLQFFLATFFSVIDALKMLAWYCFNIFILVKAKEFSSIVNKTHAR